MPSRRPADTAPYPARTLRPGDGLYPARLARLAGHPSRLRVRGDLGLRRTVAIVGARHPDAYGAEMARELGAGAARAGLSVVSGGAMGVDGAAHRGALDAGGHTVVVLGTGVDVAYPAVHRQLFQAVLEAGGALASEQPDGARGWKANFPARNRIISGLSEVVVVVQAGERSGALITAAWARSQGVPVLAVPGDVREPLSAGPVALLRGGAGVAAGVGDVLRVLRIEPAREPQLDLPRVGGDEGTLLALLGRKPRHADDLARAAALPPGAALAALLALELSGLCEQRPGHLFLRRG
jgi:DNA processing protein